MQVQWCQSKTRALLQSLLWLWVVMLSLAIESVAIPPPLSPFNENDGCEARMISLRADDSVTLRYKVTAPADYPHLGSIQVELTSETGGWLGFGVASDGTLENAIVSIGRPHGVVSKYSLPGAILMDGSQQTLIEEELYFSEDSNRTVLTFIKLLEEPNEIPILVDEPQWTMWAVGDTNVSPPFASPHAWHHVSMDLHLCLTKTTPPYIMESEFSSPPVTSDDNSCHEKGDSQWKYLNGIPKTCRLLRRLQRYRRRQGDDLAKAICQSPEFTAKTVCCNTCAPFLE